MKYYNYPNGTKTAEALDSENTSVVKGPDGKYIAPNELPAIKAEDAGKVVKVNAAGTGLEYGEAGGGYFIVNVEEDSSGGALTLTLDKTFSEIFDARDAGKTIMLVREAEGGFDSTPVLEILANSATNMYGLTVCMEMTVVVFGTNDPDGYPAFSPNA